MMAADDKKTAGVECPICGYPESSVVWTRRRVLRVKKSGEDDYKTIGAIVRARECGNEQCNYRYQTSESVQFD